MQRGQQLGLVVVEHSATRQRRPNCGSTVDGAAHTDTLSQQSKEQTSCSFDLPCGERKGTEALNPNGFRYEGEFEGESVVFPPYKQVLNKVAKINVCTCPNVSTFFNSAQRARGASLQFLVRTGMGGCKGSTSLLVRDILRSSVQFIVVHAFSHAPASHGRPVGKMQLGYCSRGIPRRPLFLSGL